MSGYESWFAGLTNSQKKSVKGLSEGALRSLKSAMSGFGKAGKVAGDAASKSIGTLKEALEELAKPSERVLNGFEALAGSARQFAEQNQKFFQAGYTSDMFGFANAISAANEASLQLNGNLGSAREVTKAFRDNTMSVALASDGLKKTLMESGVAMQGAGFEMNSFAQIVDTAAMAFNQNETQIKGLTSTLINVQKEIPVSGKQLAENFQIAQKNFAYSADKMMDNFIGLQKMSTTTGVSFSALTNTFGENLDTFQGSADMAGKLNQILGKSAFNSMELLTMTEVERAETVRNAIMNSGKSIEDMGKFELLALSKTLGLGSVAETRKFLRGDLKIDEAGAMKKIEAADPNAIKTRRLGETIDELRSGINRTRSVQDRFAIEASKMGTAAAKTALSMTTAAKKLDPTGITDDQKVQSIIAMTIGALGKERDKTTATGFTAKDIGALERLKGLTKELPPALKPFADTMAASFALANPETVAGLNMMAGAFEKLGKNLTEDKIKVIMQGANAKSFEVLVKQITTSGETAPQQ